MEIMFQVMATLHFTWGSIIETPRNPQLLELQARIAGSVQ